MRTLVLFLLIFLLYTAAEAQQITGLTRDDTGKPLADASIILKRSADSSVIKLGISNADGKYQFSSIPPGHYFITVSHIGYGSLYSGSFVVGEGSTQAPTLSLARMTAELQAAVVAVRKPLIEVRPDKIIFNVEGNINTIGEDALTLLRKSPGVSADKDNNLSLGGKNNVQIFIDGRPTYLSGAALADYLKTLPSSSVESIEILFNPGARYEAAGNAGIIDIRLKKDKSMGTNATFSAGYNQGTYGKYNGSFSFNHRDKNLNIFGEYNYKHSLDETIATQYRTQLDTLFLQNTNLQQETTTHNFRTGLDYSINKQNSIGVILSGTLSHDSVRTNSATPITYIPTGSTARILKANNQTREQHNNGNLDLNYRYADNSGHELNLDGDYGIYRLRSDQLQPNHYYDSSGKQLLYSNIYNILSPTDIDIYSFKADYEQNIGKGRLGLGGKISYVTSGNDFKEYDLVAPNRDLDSLNSNYFDYKENINALYASYNRNFKNWTIQAGLRAENTNIQGFSSGYKEDVSGGLAPYDSAFTRHYTDLFPSGSLSYNKDPARQWTLNYSRRIDRPAYPDLNPFEFKIDDYTFSKGNTLLRPQYTNSMGLSFLYKNKLVATLNYSHIRDLSTTLPDTTDRSKTIVYKENLANQNITSLSCSYPFQYKWYNGFFSATAFYALYKANFGPGRFIDLNVFNTTIYTQHSFTLGKGWTGQLTQYYTSPNIWQATLKARSLWSLDAGLQKSLFKGNGMVKASVSDIFKTLGWSATSNFAGQYIRTTGSYESRQLRLYFSYRLGNKQVKAVRPHINGAEEENKRVSSPTSGASS